MTIRWKYFTIGCWSINGSVLFCNNWDTNLGNSEQSWTNFNGKQLTLGRKNTVFFNCFLRWFHHFTCLLVASKGKGSHSAAYVLFWFVSVKWSTVAKCFAKWNGWSGDQVIRISCCNSSSHFKLHVVDAISFQTKYRNKSSSFFLKRSFYPIKT